MPTHDEIARAVAQTGDAELAAWTRAPEAYVLRKSDKVPLTHHGLWFVIPVDVSEPMSFYVASVDGGAVVTTGRPAAVAQVLADEPALRKPDAVGPAVFELLREQGRPWKLDGAPKVQSVADALDVELAVTDGRATETWKVHLDGAASTFVRGGAR